MNLKEIVEIKEESKETGVWVPWDEEGCEFKVSYAGRDLIKKARKKALKKEVNKKSHVVEDIVDEDIFDFELMNMSIVGWRGLTGKHLREILDPERTQINLNGDSQGVEIPYSQENKEIVISCYNLTFSRFISGVATEVDVYRQMKEDDARKNSESSQLGTEQTI